MIILPPKGIHRFKSNGIHWNRSNPIYHWMLDFFNQSNPAQYKNLNLTDPVGYCVGSILPLGYFDWLNPLVIHYPTNYKPFLSNNEI